MFKDIHHDHHHYHIVEVEKGSKLPEITGDLRESIKALNNHPGFIYLMQRLRFQRTALETSLKEGLNLTEVQLRYIQAGIYWAGFIERDVLALTQSQPSTRPAVVDEEAEFKRMKASLDLIGA
jgi:hypothetical protein